MAVDGGVFVRHADYRAEVLAGVRDILGDAVAERFSLKVQTNLATLPSIMGFGPQFGYRARFSDKYICHALLAPHERV